MAQPHSKSESVCSSPLRLSCTCATACQQAHSRKPVPRPSTTPPPPPSHLPSVTPSRYDGGRNDTGAVRAKCARRRAASSTGSGLMGGVYCTSGPPSPWLRNSACSAAAFASACSGNGGGSDKPQRARHGGGAAPLPKNLPCCGQMRDVLATMTPASAAAARHQSHHHRTTGDDLGGPVQCAPT